MTDVTFGFDTALGIATEAIDRLHSTAHSHHRIILCEIMGHNTGWLALGAGIAGGADVILIPEIPYDIHKIANAITQRSRGGKNFSIVAVAEGAQSREYAKAMENAVKQKQSAKSKKEKDKADIKIATLRKQQSTHIYQLSQDLDKLTHLESRATILGYVQRGGTPSAADRLLATRLGTVCASLIEQQKYGVMVAAKGDTCKAVPLDQVVGKRKRVPLDHPWIETARMVSTNMGDQ
jgi:6-phosphofructokinase 1